jgi:hypothetical protein
VPKEKRDAALKTLNDGLITERMREWDSKKPNLSDDPEVAELQQHADVPRPMADLPLQQRSRSFSGYMHQLTAHMRRMLRTAQAKGYSQDQLRRLCQTRAANAASEG